MSTSPRIVYVAASSTSAFLGKGSPGFVEKGHPLFGQVKNPDLKQHIRVVLDGIEKQMMGDLSDIQRVYIGNFAGELFNQQGHLGAYIPSVHPKLAGKPCIRVEGACASGGLAFAAAVDAVRAGVDIALVIGAEVQNTVSARQGADYLARAADYSRHREIDDFTFPALFARRIKAYREKYDITHEDLARVTLKNVNNAHRNPLAHMKATEIDLTSASTECVKNPAFLKNPELRPYLRVLDCSPVSDGASAVLIGSYEGLARVGFAPGQCVEVAAVQFGSDDISAERDLTCLSNMQAVANLAYKEANISPSNIAVAEVHDCFNIAEIMMYEALGFAESGKGADLIRSGRTEINGSLPINTGGGLIGFGHPVGATGVKQIAEIFKQMKGKAGDYQIRKRWIPYGLCANMGGDDKTAVVTILRQPTPQSSL